MKSINLPVVSYCDIPEKISQKSWISEYQCGCYVDYFISSDLKYTRNDLDEWILKEYPELLDKKFLIDIDY